MHSRGTAPCTVISYVRNGGSSFENCLRSGQFCQEHVLLDGGSTDGTVELAKEYGCTVFPQDPQYLNDQGRIIDFGGVANQALSHATKDWIVLLAADEELGLEIRQGMQEVMQSGKIGAYFVNRLFMLNGRVMKHASTNPNHQIRLCARSLLKGFKKRVHERPVLEENVKPFILPNGSQYMPLTDTPAELKAKYRGYINLEVQHRVAMSWMQWFKYAGYRIVVMNWLMSRMLMFRLLHGFRECLPLRYDMLNVWYSWQLIKRFCPLAQSSRTFA